MKAKAVIWDFDLDYPAGTPADSQLPISAVYVKTHDRTDWMSRYDQHPAAVNGLDQVRRLVDIYAAQGIEFYAWCVPGADNIPAQVKMAVDVLDIPGVKGLFFDVEPFDGFCGTRCHQAAQVIAGVRVARPDSRLGVIYDPRPWHYGTSAIGEWLRFADVAAPMCYWTDFRDNVGEWGVAERCIQNAANLLRNTLGFRGDFEPMLPGVNTLRTELAAALTASRSYQASGVSFFRRGTTLPENWDLVANLPANFLSTQPLPDTCQSDLAVAREEIDRLTSDVVALKSDLKKVTDILAQVAEERNQAWQRLAGQEVILGHYRTFAETVRHNLGALDARVPKVENFAAPA